MFYAFHCKSLKSPGTQNCKVSALVPLTLLFKMGIRSIGNINLIFDDFFDIYQMFPFFFLFDNAILFETAMARTLKKIGLSFVSILNRRYNS